MASVLPSKASLQVLRPARRTICSAAINAHQPRATAAQTAARTNLSRTQQRHASGFGNHLANLREVGRRTYKQSPIMFPVGLVLVSGSIAALLYVTYITAKVRIEMGNYPEPVAIKLRRARYFTDHVPDAAQALKAYLGAIHLAREAKMGQLSDEVLGIWVEMARCLEVNGNHKEAIELLENTRKDCLLWVDEHGQDEGMVQHRTRLLQYSIKLAHKIAELYSGPYHPSQAKAEEYLVWAVQTALKENARRQREGLRPGEGEYFTADQQGAQLEDLGHHYERNDQHYYASQLFLQALMIKPTTDCHNVVLMNNLAASIVQQAPPREEGQAPATQAQLRQSGRAWAVRALELAAKIAPPGRNEECDQGCAVATHNLGEFAEMDGNVKEARERYEEAYSLAHAIGFDEGIEAAAEGLERVSGKRPPRKKQPRGGKEKTTGWFSWLHT